MTTCAYATDDEVADLEERVELRGPLAHRTLGEETLGLWEVRELAGQFLVELMVRGEDGDERGGRGLLAVALGQVLGQALARLGGTDRHDTQRLLAHRGGGVLDQVVYGLDLVVRSPTRW